MMQYYYEGNNEDQLGPISLDQLIELNIDKSTRVWREGMSAWDEAGNLLELEVLFDEQKKAAYKEQQRAAIHSKFQGDKVKAKKKIWRNAVGLFLIIGAIVSAGLIITEANRTTKNDASDPAHGSGKRDYQEKKMSIKETERAYPLRFLNATGNARGTILGRKAVYNGTVSNTASIIGYSTIKLRFTFFSGNKQLGSHTEILNERVNPGYKVSFRYRIPIPSGTNSISCSIADAKPVN